MGPNGFEWVFYFYSDSQEQEVHNALALKGILWKAQPAKVMSVYHACLGYSLSECHWLPAHFSCIRIILNQQYLTVFNVNYH